MGGPGVGGRLLEFSDKEPLILYPPDRAQSLASPGGPIGYGERGEKPWFSEVCGGRGGTWASRETMATMLALVPGWWSPAVGAAWPQWAQEGHCWVGAT